MINALTALVFLTHLAATLFMTGLIWFVQVVHYPLFDGAGANEFAAYEQRHRERTTYLVAPAMILEAATAVLLAWFRPDGVTLAPLTAGWILLVVVWGSTALIQVPCHELLSQCFDAKVHRRLVWTNWIRTGAWSLRGLLVLWMAWQPIRATTGG